MKKILSLICLVFTVVVVSAQKKQNVYFLKNDGKKVNNADSSDFIRIIQEPDSGETNFVLLEYHLNKKRKTTGKVSGFESGLIFEGQLAKFNEQGKRIELTTYERGFPMGMSYLFFNNGKMHKQIEYEKFEPQIDQMLGVNLDVKNLSPNPNAKLIYLADSNGVEQVKDGNGHAREVRIFENSISTEEGDYKEGVKHGLWKGTETIPAYSYTETYEMGKLIAGEATQGNQKYPYNSSRIKPAEYKGGIKKFYEYVGYSLRYPTDAVDDKASGSVLLAYTVEKDGSIADIEVKRSVHYSLDLEAKRVLSRSPKWLPATFRGIPVRMKYVIPIKFNMGGL